MAKEYEDFDNAEEVWFWYCRSLVIRDGGLRTRTSYSGVERPCELGDIGLILKKMRLCQHISNRQLRVLQRWGMYQVPPYYDKRAKRSEIRLWEEGIRVLDSYLRNQRILKA